MYVRAHILNYTEYMNVDTISTIRENTAVVMMIWKGVVSKKKKNREIARLICLKESERISQNRKGHSEADKAIVELGDQKSKMIKQYQHCVWEGSDKKKHG
jgi:hypothetical protein